ncbi:Gfo/Idh/MocA family protein [Magnetospirillum sulfuroxidans]|uniref:Gfo/Idh/MocA family oxidoreductase n=1 Tax=Magnetospirillum sulfuroxidans TaxID=611300 RepID=A0ABS5IEX3_9PROT|nr:Gfo/Idh/MocA family oxidoreductase [Magnetospirillum sulfuroxidans]MBR9972874.1 Gfo/Idh/MocA family oxidoreductase [Magnetospirillum sulfuroxidans]
MIAVLGLGSIGMRHARNALALGQDVIGFDPAAERRHLLEAAGADATDDGADAIARARAVVIATPSECHLDDLADCLAAGRHVLVEKPLAHRAAGLAALLDRAEKEGLVVAVAMMLRLHPAVIRARAILASGALGTPLWGRFLAALYLPEWRPGQDWTQGYANDPRTGGALFDYIHEVDLATHLLGPAQALACVAGHSGTIGLTAEDSADVILGHAGIIHSNIHVDYVTRPRRRFGEIAGTAGLLRLDLDNRRVEWHDTSGRIIEDTQYPGSYADDYLAEMAAFIAAIGPHAPSPPCTGREALAVLECLISARTLAGLPT